MKTEIEIVISGAPGAGKTYVAHTFASILQACGFEVRVIEELYEPTELSPPPPSVAARALREIGPNRLVTIRTKDMGVSSKVSVGREERG